MRGAPDIGQIKARNEVEPHGEGYRGVITIVGQGTWHTPEAQSREGAQTLLDALNKQLLPKTSGDGISNTQRQDMQKALAAIAASDDGFSIAA